MKRILFFLFGFSFALQAQLPSLSFTNVTGSASITCTTPTINVLASVNNYTAGALTYTWVGLTTSLSGTNVSVTLPDTYTVTAYNSSNSFSITQTIAIGINTTQPTSTLTPLSMSISCIPFTSATFTGQCNSANVTHLWQSPFLYAVATDTGVSSTYNTSAPGTGTYCVKDNTSGCSTCKTFTITSNDAFPTYSISSSNQFSIGCGTNSLTTINISNASTYTSAFGPPTGGPVSYTILPPGYTGSYTLSTISVASASVPGTYTVILHDNTNNCESKVPVTILQHTLVPVINFSSTTPTLSCYTPSIVLQGSSTTPGVTYLWHYPGSGTATTNTIVVNATSVLTSTFAGTYSLTVTSNSNACTSTSVISFYQNMFSPASSIGGPNSVSCLSPTVTFSNTSTSTMPSIFTQPLPVVGYEWHAPAPQFSLGLSATYTAYTAGVYTLVAMDLNNGCTAIATKTLVLTGTPQLSSPTVFNVNCPTPTVAIFPTIAGSTAGMSFLWTVPPTASVSGLTTQTIVTNAAGVYTITATGSVSTCVSTTVVNVAVCAALMETITFEEQVLVYPNPATDVLYIDLSAYHDEPFLKVMIVNELCQLVKEEDLHDHVLDVRDLPDGVYLLLFKNKTGQTAHKKFVVSH